MIVDIKRFVAIERPFWDELAAVMKRCRDDPSRRMAYHEIKRLYYLYQRTSADLSKIRTFTAEKAVRDYLEVLVGQAYAVIHTGHKKAVRFSPFKWFWNIFPRTLRRHWVSLALSVAIFLVGGLFGGGAIMADPAAKSVLMPFEHLQMDPADRVAREELADHHDDRRQGGKSSFSAFLMTHNTRVSIFVLALGMTWGIGTFVLLFSNGVMLGAVAADYILNGQSVFLLGWLLPHGVIEIPAILVAGQAGLMLAGALIGRQSALSLADRVRRVGPDVVHLIGGVAIMLVWAGIVEAFFSQYHEPVLPYSFKIAFGFLELSLLTGFLLYAGKKGTGTVKQMLRRARK